MRLKYLDLILDLDIDFDLDLDLEVDEIKILVYKISLQKSYAKCLTTGFYRVKYFLHMEISSICQSFFAKFIYVFNMKNYSLKVLNLQKFCKVDMVVPIFTFLQFFFYMGWLKVKKVIYIQVVH